MKKSSISGFIVVIGLFVLFSFIGFGGSSFAFGSIFPFVLIAIGIPLVSRFLKKANEQQSEIKKQNDEKNQTDDFQSNYQDTDKSKYDLGSRYQDDNHHENKTSNYRTSYRNETPTKPIDDISAMVNKSSKRCHNCHALIDAGDKRCPECGARQKDTVICPYCGHKNPASNALCEKCNGFL